MRATYRRLLAVRRRSEALHAGSFAFVSSGDADVLAFVREAEGERVLVLINFSTEARRAVIPDGAWRPLFDTDEPQVGTDRATGAVELEGLQAVVLTSTAGSTAGSA